MMHTIISAVFVDAASFVEDTG